MANYFEKLKDPRWQRRRLEIMQRANFACEMCGDTSETLNVHHGYYSRGLDPWDYDDHSLHCLCEACHVKVGNATTSVHQYIAWIPMNHFVRVCLAICRFVDLILDFGPSPPAKDGAESHFPPNPAGILKESAATHADSEQQRTSLRLKIWTYLSDHGNTSAGVLAITTGATIDQVLDVLNSESREMFRENCDGLWYVHWKNKKPASS
jgi:hypothetical protein